jgi:DUF1009 family protein
VAEAAPAGKGSAPDVAILAASGHLPLLVARSLAASNRTFRIVGFRGFCDRRTKAEADALVNLLDLRRLVTVLEGWQPGVLTLAGGLTRPSPSALIGAYSAYRDRDYVASVVSKGDDNLLRGAIELLESKGFVIAGIRELAPELLATACVYGVHQPTASAMASISYGYRMLDALSPYDVGQAAVVTGQRVVAIEGPEGTDRMLARAGRLARSGWLRRRTRGGILVKGPKVGQDLRIDLPAIGPRTVAKAVKAGLEGIAVASGTSLILDRDATIAAANKAGIFLMGVDRSLPEGEAYANG